LTIQVKKGTHNVEPTPLPTKATMDFATRLTTQRKQQGLTQQALADRIGAHVTQIRRYEAATATPTLDALKNLAIGLSTTIDALAFAPEEREPTDDLKLAFEATQHLNPEEQHIIKELIEAMLLKHEAKRWTNAS
jgi:transcriptional regulator with XRE-family HTH domain